VDEVVDILTKALLPATASPPACMPGTFADTPDAAAATRCTACAPGSYAALAGSAVCKRCAPGRAAAALGSIACRTCQPGTYSAADGAACLPCPDGETFMLPCLLHSQSLSYQSRCLATGCHTGFLLVTTPRRLSPTRRHFQRVAWRLEPRAVPHRRAATS
jgi:hypothetical protein